MSDIEAKALAMLNEEAGHEYIHARDMADKSYEVKALCRSIEQHEAFKQEVSDAVSALLDRFLGDMLSQGLINGHMHRFITPKPKPKPDPLAGVLEEVFSVSAVSGRINAALEARGLEIVPCK
jgi:hypothetical protein